MTVPEFLNWSIALAPVLLVVVLFVWLDVFKLMSAPEVLSLLALGALASLIAYPVSGRVLDALPMGFSNYSKFVAPWIEEAIKGSMVIGLFAFNRMGFKLDAAISGFAVGAGFSVVENILYLVHFDRMSLGVWVVRGLGTAIMHGGTVAIMAALSHELSERATRGQASKWRFNPLWFLPGYIVAVGIHILFNHFPDRPLLAMLGVLVTVPITLMLVFRFGASEAQGWLKQESDAHRADLAVLRAGEFPDSDSGRRIAALAARINDDATTGLIRDYLEIHTWLVLSAEETLLSQSQTETRVNFGEARDGFRRLHDLKRALGRTTLASLNPLLPFSRNDLWEMSELKERMKRTQEAHD